MATNVWGLALKMLLAYSQAEQQQTEVDETISLRNSELLLLKQKLGAVIVLLGTRGTGKTEMALRLAEFLDKPVFMVAPEQQPPHWVKRITLADLFAVPPQSTVIIDDLPVVASNRDYRDTLVNSLERLIPMVRHDRQMHLIFSTQSSAAADKYILDCDMAFFKPQGLLTADSERPNIVRIYKQWVNPMFDGQDELYVLTHAYMLSRRYRGPIEISKTS